MNKYFIVWNPTKTEGFITDDRRDAVNASTGERLAAGVSVVGEKFYDTYSDDGAAGKIVFEIQEVELTP